MDGNVNGVALVQAIPAALCEETSDYDQDSEQYVRCGAQAAMVVLNAHGGRLYFMCRACGSIAVRHHGMTLIAEAR